MDATGLSTTSLFTSATSRKRKKCFDSSNEEESDTGKRSEVSNNATVSGVDAHNEESLEDIFHDKLIQVKKERLEYDGEELYDEELAERLRNLDVDVPYEESPSRAHEGLFNCRARMTDSYNAKMKSGKFNVMEDKCIRANWEAFSTMYQFDDPVVFCSSKCPQYWKCIPQFQRKKFVEFLANKLPNRYLHSVYWRFMILYQDKIQGHFTKTEDDLIRSEVGSRSSNGRTNCYFKRLSLLLNRDRHSIYRRSVYLKFGPTRISVNHNRRHGSISWNLEKLEKLMSVLMRMTKSSNLKELQGTIPHGVWIKVEKEFDVEHNSLRHLWNTRLCTQLFAKRPLFRNKICSKILYKLNSRKYRHWQDVQWNKMAEEFHGISGVYLHQLFWGIANVHVPEEKRKSLRYCVKYMIKYWKSTIVGEDKEYPRLKFVNGKLVKYFRDRQIVSEEEDEEP